jgi:aspartokinase/homoserine dehydrogenase 1
VYLLREASPRTLDGVMSYGERLSAPVVAAALTAVGVEAEALDARELIVTDDGFGAARVDTEPTFARIARTLEAASEGRAATPVLAGFVGASQEGHTTTLGRGGSDLTAALVGAALGAEVVELWTDVAGVMSADPRQVPDAFPLPRLSYAELMELSHFGAKVVYPPTVHPARAQGIPLVIKSTLEPDAPGTHIGAEAPESPYPVRAISSIHRVAMMRLEGDGMVGVPGIAQRLFGALARKGVSVILISQASSEHSICFAVAPEETERAQKSVDSEFRLERRAGLIDELTVEEDVAILAAVGEGMRERHGLAGRLFGVLGDHGVNVRAIAQGSSERNVSIVVAAGDETRALRAVHGAFFTPRRRRIELAVVGTGRVARAFLSELAEAAPKIARDEEVDLRLVALWNTRRMALAPDDEEGQPLDPAAWEPVVEGAGAPDLEALVRRLTRRRGPTRVLVDLTGTDALVPLARRLLESGVALVAANKVPFAGPFERYRELVEAAGRGGAALRLEATVGAGLPVLSTLDDLVRTGDRIERVEGLLSGTLNFVLDRLGAGERFSRAVRRAHEKGLTEPHPAEDLSGGDVVRKLVILARRAGPELHPRLEPEEVGSAPLLSADRDWTELELDDFFREIEAFDDEWARRQKEAADGGKRLRHVASLERRGARVEITAVSSDHPCFEVAAADNLVAFTTARYHTTPLVLRGPGAGPEVTAAGVFADVLRAAGRT